MEPITNRNYPPCCDFMLIRPEEFEFCPVIQHGSEHLHTDCRACRYNYFDFYTTLLTIRKKMSLTDPIWTGTLPYIDEEILVARDLKGIGVECERDTQKILRAAAC